MMTWSRSRRMRAVCALLLVLSVSGCVPLPQKGPEAPLTRAVLSLDWVPNTNHTGFYVALDKGWYAQEGIDLEIQIPSDPAAALKQVAAGNTPFGVSFQEEVTIARANGIPVVSIAAIIQHNTSAFAALKSSGIKTAKDFAGKTYASYGLPIERPVLGALMKCSGANVDDVQFVDVGFDAFPALLAGRVDLAWIFLAWDGIQAQLKGVELATVPLYGSCVPDYYTPVVIAGESTLKEHPDLTRRFMAATARGYAYAIDHPDESAQILLKHSPESSPELVKASQRWLSPRYAQDAPRWGEQRLAVWADFASFLWQNGLLPKKIDPERAFTNEYLPDTSS